MRSKFKAWTISAPVSALAVAATLFTGALGALAETPVAPSYSRAELEAKWAARIRSFLAKGIIPLVDLESSLSRASGERYLRDALPAMDEAGIALIAFDGAQAPKTSGDQKGYRWSYYVDEIVNAYPDRFILAPNGGVNPNWTQGKSDFIGQTEVRVRSGHYPIMGEYEFRHYMSSQQCKDNRTERDVDVPLDGANGHRLFRLSADTGIAFLIHNEPEDASLGGLEKMLMAYPKAKVIQAHFGQIRHPERETQFTPERVRRMLATHPNLYFDISTGAPGRRYRCADGILDVVLWRRDGESQMGKLIPAYKAILTEFSTRFVTGMDYGGGRSPLPEFIEARAKNARLIIRDLPDGARHDIAYRNAWKLLTGRDWKPTE